MFLTKKKVVWEPDCCIICIISWISYLKELHFVDNKKIYSVNNIINIADKSEFSSIVHDKMWNVNIFFRWQVGIYWHFCNIRIVVFHCVDIIYIKQINKLYFYSGCCIPIFADAYFPIYQTFYYILHFCWYIFSIYQQNVKCW